MRFKKLFTINKKFPNNFRSILRWKLFWKKYNTYYNFLFNSGQKETAHFRYPNTGAGLILFSVLIYQTTIKCVTLSIEQQSTFFGFLVILGFTFSLSKKCKLLEFWFSAYMYHHIFFRRWLFFYMRYENKLQGLQNGKWVAYCIIFLLYCLFIVYRPSNKMEYAVFFLLFMIVGNNVLYYRLRKSFINHYHLKISENISLDWKTVEKALNGYCEFFGYFPIELERTEKFPNITSQGFFSKNANQLESYANTVDLNKVTSFAFTLPALTVLILGFFKIAREIVEYCIEMENFNEKIELCQQHIESIQNDFRGFFVKETPPLKSIENIRQELESYENARKQLFQEFQSNRSFYSWTKPLLRPLLQREFRGRKRDYLKYLEEHEEV
jgi:hypothetical protein